jgi:hypothetical protein
MATLHAMSRLPEKQRRLVAAMVNSMIEPEERAA